MTEETVNFDYRNLVLKTLQTKVENFLIGIAVFTLFVAGSTYFLSNTALLNFRLPPSVITQKPPIKHTTVATNKPQTYQIQEGDWIWKVAEEKYGDGNKAQEILKANNLTDPNEIKIGQVLVLPTNIPTITPTSTPTQIPTVTLVPSATPTPSVTQYQQGQVTDNAAQTKQVRFKGKKYKIETGDGIWQVAEKAYGDGMMWSKIAEANKLKDPYNLEVGKVLIIPR